MKKILLRLKSEKRLQNIVLDFFCELFSPGTELRALLLLWNKPLWLNALKIKSGAQPAMVGGMEIGHFAKCIDTFLLKSTQM